MQGLDEDHMNKEELLAMALRFSSFYALTFPDIELEEELKIFDFDRHMKMLLSDDEDSEIEE